MKAIVDRYVLRLFVKVLLVSFASLTGLFIVIDALNNVDDFLTLAEARGSLTLVLWEYYHPRVLTFFDRTSGLLVLVAAMFTITLLQRHNELTALMAAGIPKRRVVKPLIVAAVLVSGLAIVNRELFVPAARGALTRNVQNWRGDQAQRLRPCYDRTHDLLIGGRQLVVAERAILDATVRLHRPLGQFRRQLVAERAWYRPACDQHPGGWLLDGVQQPADPGAFASAHVDGRPVILSPSDTPWLAANQCFLVSDVTLDDLRADGSRHQYQSLAWLLRSLRRESVDYGGDVRVAVHARLVQPVLDLTLLLLGLPLVLTREPRNVFVAAGMCLVLVAAFFLVVLCAQALGTAGYLLSPALAAWLPLIVFVPLAYAAIRPLWLE